MTAGQVTPPAEQTTAAEPGITSPTPTVEPRRPELTVEDSDNAEPRPSTLATQEVRLALAFSGGVSLAIWMGGVARELDLLVQASDRRRSVGDPGPPDPATPDPSPLRRLYRRLLDVVDAQVAIDVLSGTSAGGINAAVLGLVNVRGGDLAKLRELWITAGDLGGLMRDPRQPSPPSLLQGDGQMLAALNKGIADLVRGSTPPDPVRTTDVYITTTLLSPETSSVADDYGTQITDTDHHAKFHFDESSLLRDDVLAPLALAARSSASFPGAFEPSFVGFGPAAADPADPLHPDMSRYVDSTASHWTADGGLLVNRPIAPLLQRIFDREADRQVRRALLYVVPTSGPTMVRPPDAKSAPLVLTEGLLRDFGAVVNQSVAADLAAIKEHNDRTRASADTRLRMAALGARLPEQASLLDAPTWRDYCVRQAEWLTAPLISELSRQLDTLPSVPAGWKPSPGTDRDDEIRSVARATVMDSWPLDVPPQQGAAALDAAVGLGRSAFDTAKATTLELLRLGYVLASSRTDRNHLARLGMCAHRALEGGRQQDLRGLVYDQLRGALPQRPERSDGTAKAQPTLPAFVAALTRSYVAAQGTPDELRQAWQALADVTAEAMPLLTELAASGRPTGNAPDPGAALRDPGAGRLSLEERRALAAGSLAPYLAFLRRGDPVGQLLALHVAVRSVLPVLVEVDQPVQLIQVSADTRSLLAPDHPSATTKLTGMQVHHFGAFYKASWRANDWMWGRLDGCGWLVHVLLDPRRILTVMQDDEVPAGSRADEFLDRLARALDGDEAPQVRSGLARFAPSLAFLDDENLPLPASLPDLALHVASYLQRYVVAEELPVVAGLLADPADGPASTDAMAWLARYRASGWANGQVPPPDTMAQLLNECPVAGETLRDEANRRTPLFLRTVSQATAVVTSAGTGMREPPASLRPLFSTARGVTQLGYSATHVTGGFAKRMVWAGLGLLVLGVFAMMTNAVLLGFAGVVVFGAGALLLAFALGRRTLVAVNIVLVLALVLLAAAPWIPWLDQRVFSWISRTAVPWVHEHSWVWPVLLFLVLLPPLTTVVGLLRRRPGTAAAREPAVTGPGQP